MQAFKFLDPGGSTVFTATSWALPDDGRPGDWVEAEAVRPCQSGIHACEVGDLAYWLAADLWQIELDGEVEHARHKIVARRGRLVRRVEAWRATVAAELPRWCAWQTRQRAIEVLDALGENEWAARYAAVTELEDLRRLARPVADALGEASEGATVAALAADAAALSGWLGIGPFIAACAAGHVARRAGGGDASYEAGFATERAVQSAWIADRLDLQ